VDAGPACSTETTLRKNWAGDNFKAMENASPGRGGLDSSVDEVGALVASSDHLSLVAI
jgi:hypothetical protein